MPKFSQFSLDNLRDVDPRLKSLCNRAIQIVDFRVTEGYRDARRQNELYETGMSKVRHPNSKHNSFPSKAIDCVPCPIDWEDQRRFYYLAGIFKAIAWEMGFELRHGGDWDGDDIFKDQKFFDLPHFEIID